MLEKSLALRRLSRITGCGRSVEAACWCSLDAAGGWSDLSGNLRFNAKGMHKVLLKRTQAATINTNCIQWNEWNTRECEQLGLLGPLKRNRSGPIWRVGGQNGK
jgi:hypothetical protein